MIGALLYCRTSHISLPSFPLSLLTSINTASYTAMVWNFSNASRLTVVHSHSFCNPSQSRLHLSTSSAAINTFPFVSLMECVNKIVNLFLLSDCLLPVRLLLFIYFCLSICFCLSVYEVVAHIE